MAMQPQRPFKRKDRVRSLVLTAISEILLREVEFNPGILATITDVEVTDKLDYAKVYVAVLPADRADEAMLRLDKRLPYLQHLLHRKMNIRPTPTISFILDKGAAAAARVEKALLEDSEKNS